MDASEKARESRARRAAARQGLRLERSRVRDPRAPEFGTYMLSDLRTRAVIAYGLQSGFGLTIDEVEAALR